MTNTSPELLRIYLIRHGETEWSISGQHTGRTDIPLTTHGEEQAAKLELYFKNISFTQVLTSPMQRARQTCALAGLGNVSAIADDLSEWNYGVYEGLRSVDIREQRVDWNIFRDGCPQGESPEQIGQRADRFITQLRKIEGNIALFSHGHFSSVLATRWIGLPVLNAQHFSLSTASVSTLTYSANHPEIAVIALWNAVPGNGL